jgi:predicted CXXCH cytochrome family protein
MRLVAVQTTSNIAVFIVVMSTFFLMADSPKKDMTLLAPSPGDTNAYDEGQIFLLSVAKGLDSTLLVSAQWETENYIDLTTNEARQGFPKLFYKLFEPQTTLQLMTYSYRTIHGYTQPETVNYAYTDTMNIKNLWGRPELANLMKGAQNADFQYVLLHLRGWKDSLYSTTFDDPSADSRSLYKIQVHLLAGTNALYFAPSGRKSDAIEFTKNYQNEFLPLDSRTWHFHNSDLEKGCTTCHDGLPSSFNGDSMKADCATCHKALAGGAYKHSPVEMNECEDCHSWSVEKKAMIVTKGMPDACYDCHEQRRAQVDSSAVPHPVAGDCLTCHSPHSTRNEHILKKDIYALCSSCHPEYTLNHPVGHHPVRFLKIANQGNKEISCVSCHQPHGSQNQSLLNVSGGRMMVCLQCHNK